MVDAIAMDVHSHQFLLTSIYINSDSNNNSDSISFLNESWSSPIIPLVLFVNESLQMLGGQYYNNALTVKFDW